MNEYKKILQSVMDGDEAQTVRLCEALLEKGYAPIDILEKGLIPAMDQSGMLLNRQERFIPQIILSVQAMQGAIRILQPFLYGAEKRIVHDKVVVGTVQGDIHNIGKSLVAIMLRGAGFEVVDLGTNVSPKEFSSAIRESGACIVAMSAMLTTAMSNMRATVQALRNEKFDHPICIIVGGAPITQNFAKELGVHFGGNVLETANLALSLRLHEDIPPL